jgi:hypothetical protein
LRISSAAPQEWPQRDVVLPAGWQAIEVEGLWLRGHRWRLLARQGRPATLTAS